MAAPMYAQSPKAASRRGKFKPCLVEDCDGNADRSAAGIRGWCVKHYCRWKTHGDPLGGRPTFNGEPMKFIQEVAIPYDGSDCLVWPYAKGSMGRGSIRIGGKTLEVNRLICEGRHGPPPSPEHEAAHECGNGHLACCNPLHLRWDTHTGNQRDRVAHGTSNRGEQSGLAKLTEDQVRHIRSLRGKMPYRLIAEMFGVAAPTISAICNRYSWAWLKD